MSSLLPAFVNPNPEEREVRFFKAVKLSLMKKSILPDTQSKIKPFLF